MAVIIDGKAVAARVRAEAAREAARLKACGVAPTLSVILVGDDPASRVYVRQKTRACAEVGIRSNTMALPSDVTHERLAETIMRQNMTSDVHGILLQLPLPAHLDARAVTDLIDPRKDVDGFTAQNVAALYHGGEGLYPCTPSGCLALLKAYDIPLESRHAVVIGRSALVGKPLALMLLHENCTVTVCHSRTSELKSLTAQADILVSAVGKAGLVTADMIKPGAAVIDVGISRLLDGSLAGDVDFAGASDIAGYITPVPGGVGPMTVAMLMKNTVKAASGYAL